MSRITDNIDLRIEAAPADRAILLVRGVETEKLSRDAALAIARRYRGDFELIVSGRKIRKMIQIQKPEPVWQRGYRTLEAASYSPWPGWHLRYE